MSGLQHGRAIPTATAVETLPAIGSRRSLTVADEATVNKPSSAPTLRSSPPVCYTELQRGMLPYSQLVGTAGTALRCDVAAVMDVIDNKGGTNPERRTELIEGVLQHSAFQDVTCSDAAEAIATGIGDSLTEMYNSGRVRSYFGRLAYAAIKDAHPNPNPNPNFSVMKGAAVRCLESWHHKTAGFMASTSVGMSATTWSSSVVGVTGSRLRLGQQGRVSPGGNAVRNSPHMLGTCRLGRSLPCSHRWT